MRITVGSSARRAPDSAHRAEATEGDAAIRLLESRGFPMKRKANNQAEFSCPFHEGEGPVPPRKSANFYVHATTSQYYCQAASCGEKGNLVTLEHFFGVDTGDPVLVTRESQLREWESALTKQRRTPFYDHGLNDTTIERFRLGFDEREGRYVIPYLEGRRPRAFRWYAPYGEPSRKYTWEQGTNARLFNASDGVGDADGVAWLTEGELKAMLLCQLGYAAVGVPGAAMFKPEWHAAFADARKIIVCYDSDNPDHHIHDNCRRCAPEPCRGHNPGQEAAARVVEALAWRAVNVELPRPPHERKTDINEFFVRDGHTGPELAELALGVKRTPYRVRTLEEIFADPPPLKQFLVAHGILSAGGRLVITGAPKVGKSLLAQHLALSIAAGIPFLGRFGVSEPSRVLLLDRELSERSLFERFETLLEHRPGYRAALRNLAVDHEVMFKIDRASSVDVMRQLVEQNGVQVIVLDAAYKFFAGSFTDSSIAAAFDHLDELIAATGVSVVLTHHHRKHGVAQGKGAPDMLGDPDDIAGSFLWTGWPNAVAMLNFLERRVENPFNAVCTFTAFRDAPPPEPLALYRDRSSIAYSDVSDYVPTRDGGTDGRRNVYAGRRPTAELLGELLLDVQPIAEADFLHLAAAKFQARPDTVRPHLLDLLSQGDFVKETRQGILRFAHERQEESWEAAREAARHRDVPLFVVPDIPEGET